MYQKYYEMSVEFSFLESGLFTPLDIFTETRAYPSAQAHFETRKSSILPYFVS